DVVVRAGTVRRVRRRRVRDAQEQLADFGGQRVVLGVEGSLAIAQLAGAGLDFLRGRGVTGRPQRPNLVRQRPDLAAERVALADQLALASIEVGDAVDVAGDRGVMPPV